MAQVPAAPQTEKLLATRGSFRWIQLFFGIICMVMIANLQYGWTLFVNPISDKFGWTRAAIQVAFSIFVLTETWLVPVEGYLVDRFGPRPVVLVGGLFCGIGWIMNSFADSLMLLYVGGGQRSAPCRLPARSLAMRSNGFPIAAARRGIDGRRIRRRIGADRVADQAIMEWGTRPRFSTSASAGESS